MRAKNGAGLIIALDLPDATQALGLARDLRGIVPWCKVGLELFCAAGPPLLSSLRAMGYRIFLDLKFYDIPNTVARAVRSAVLSGADMLTIHCQGGSRMCHAAMEAVEELPRERRPFVIGVTALTSFGPGEMPGIARDPGEFAIMLAGMACEWGLDGIVCSGHELAPISAAYPRMLRVCPGIRPAGCAAGDQTRVMSPAEAVRNGASFLVAGRPILEAPSPAGAARAILAEMDKAEEEGANENFQ